MTRIILFIFALSALFNFRIYAQSQYPKNLSLSLYGQQLNKNKKYDSAIIVFNQSVLKRTQNNIIDSLAFDQYNLGVAYYSTGQLDKSLLSYLEAEKTLDQQKDSSSLRGITYLNLGYAYKKTADYTNALKYLFLAENVIPDKTKHKASAFSALGSLLKNNDEFDKAFEYYEKASAIYDLLNLPNKKAKVLTNKGIAFTKLKAYHQAKKLFQEALQLKNLQQDSLSYSTTLQNIGWMHLELGQYDSAEISLQQTIEIKEAIRDSLNLANSYNQIGELYLKQNSFGKAFKYLNQALAIAQARKVLDKEREVLFNLSEYYRIKGNFEIQGTYLKKYIEVNNLILNEEKIKGIQKLALNQQITKVSSLEKNISTLVNEFEQQGNLLFLAICGILFLLALFSLLIYFFFSLKRSKNQVEILKDEMQHRIKNHLQQLSSIIKLQSNRQEDQNIKEALKAGENRVNAMNIIHQMLYEKESDSEIKIAKYIKELCDNLSYTYKTESKKISLYNETNDIIVNVDKTISIGLIINELVTNAIKYTTQNSKISITSKIIDEKNLFLEVSDNGTGLPDIDVTKKPGAFGLNLVNTLTKQLKAHSNFYNKNGAVFQFSIPL